MVTVPLRLLSSVITFLFSALSRSIYLNSAYSPLDYCDIKHFAAGLWVFSLDLLCFAADLFKMLVLSSVCVGDEREEKIATQENRNLVSIIINISI